MTTALLILTLLSAEETVSTTVEPDEWPLEGTRRTRFIVGARVHGGMLMSVNAPRMILQSEFMFFVSFRVMAHHEWRWGIGLFAGYPDLAGGSTTVSFRYHLNPRLSVGLGAFTHWGVSSMVGGLEVPIAVRLGSNRRHEITLAFRGGAGAYNNSAYIAWYFFNQLRPAWTLDAVVGYAAVF